MRRASYGESALLGGEDASHLLPLHKTAADAAEEPRVGQHRSVFSFATFNRIQSECFHAAFASAANFVVAAPTGSGKTVLFELAILAEVASKAATASDRGLYVYVSPTKALCHERFVDWSCRLKRANLRCSHVTTSDGSSEEESSLLDECDVAIMTVEKFDSLTRSRGSMQRVARRLRLLMVDEIHTIGEGRGAAIEAVVSRMHAGAACLPHGVLPPRIAAISATIGNIENVKEWLATLGRRVFAKKYSDVDRALPSYRHVQSHPGGTGNPYQFENSLSVHLLPIIERHSAGKAVLIFCSTRRSAESTARYLSGLLVNSPCSGEVAGSFTDGQLNTLAAKGVSYHHAGLSLDDRRAIEYHFTKGTLRILCTTSTLAMGVNLPAHLVIIKGTKQYTSSGYQEYSTGDISQMAGRAGRPEYDTFGVTVILTTDDMRSTYEGQHSDATLDSRLLETFADVLCAEVAVHTITTKDAALAWLKTTFLYVRARAAPRHYGVPNGASLDEHLLGVVEAAIQRCAQANLLSKSGGGMEALLSPTERGRVSSRYFISIRTMEMLLVLPSKPSHEAMLEYACRALDPELLRFQAGDKGYLAKAARHSSMRFRVKGRISEGWQKAFYAAQIVLAKDEQLRCGRVFGQSSKAIVARLQHLFRCIVDICTDHGASGAALKSAIELRGALEGQMWHDSPCLVQQIEGIGAANAAILGRAGISSPAQLLAASPSTLEMVLKRNPPFGHHLQEASRKFPRFSLDVTATFPESGEAESRGDGRLLHATLSVHYDVRLSANADCHLIVIGGGEEDAQACHHRERICHSAAATRTLSVRMQRRAGPWQVTVSLMCSTCAGANVHKIISEDSWRAAGGTLQVAGSGEASRESLGRLWVDRLSGSSGDFSLTTSDRHIESPDAAPSRAVAPSALGRKSGGKATARAPAVKRAKAPAAKRAKAVGCNHQCREKTLCRHQCCKALPVPPPRDDLEGVAREGAGEDRGGRRLASAPGSDHSSAPGGPAMAQESRMARWLDQFAGAHCAEQGAPAGEGATVRHSIARGPTSAEAFVRMLRGG